MVGGRVGSVEHINMFVCRVKSSIECFIIGPFTHFIIRAISAVMGAISVVFSPIHEMHVCWGKDYGDPLQRHRQNQKIWEKLKEWIRSQFVLFVPFKIMGELHELPLNVKLRDLQFFFNLVDKCLNYPVIISDLCLSYIISNSVKIFIWLNE